MVLIDLYHLPGNCEIVKLLVERGGAAVDIKDAEEQTPLILAVHHALNRNYFANLLP